MMSSWWVLLVAPYVYASLIMAPLFLAYAFVSARRTSLPFALTVHKLLVVLTALLPLTLLVTSTSTPDLDAARTNDAPAANVSEPTALAAHRQARGTMPDTTALAWGSSDKQAVNDVLYFYGGFLGWLSIAGLMVFISRYAMQSLLMHRLARDADHIETREGIAIIRSEGASAPFSVGCISSRVVLPCWLDTPAAELAIRHELNHFKRRHHWWALLESTLAHVFWFNPTSHWLRRRGDYYRELECDAMTTRGMDKFYYARVLLESAERIMADRRHSLGGHAWIEKKSLKARIDFLLGEPRTTRRIVSLSALAAVLAFAAAGAIFVGNVNDEFLRREILESINRQYADSSNRQMTVRLDRVPKSFIRALLVYYDPTFYEHGGISLFKGPTITQQLARSFLRPAHPSVDRKVREFTITRVLENHFSKDQILEMYLNRTYWGNHANNLAAAAMTYFGKPYTELTESESALLIPSLVAPSIWNVRDNPTVAAQRQRQLLNRLAALDRAR